MLVKCLLLSCHVMCAWTLEGYNTPWQRQISRISPNPFIGSKKCLRVMIYRSVGEGVWIMKTSRDSNHIIDDSKVVREEDDLDVQVSRLSSDISTRLLTWAESEYRDLRSKKPSPCHPGFWNRLNGEPSTHKNPPLHSKQLGLSTHVFARSLSTWSSDSIRSKWMASSWWCRIATMTRW